jgi:hypothetical protein
MEVMVGVSEGDKETLDDAFYLNPENHQEAKNNMQRAAANTGPRARGRSWRREDDRGGRGKERSAEMLTVSQKSRYFDRK